MKKLLFLSFLAVCISGCRPTASVPQPTTSPAATALPDQNKPPENSAPASDADYNLTITDKNFGTDELYAQKGDPLVISIRNQLQDPVNLTIDELNVHSKNVGFGEVTEVTVPTDEVGEFEIYSSIGNQKNEGFTALLTIEE